MGLFSGNLCIFKASFGVILGAIIGGILSHLGGILGPLWRRNRVTDSCMAEIGVTTQGKKKLLGHMGGTVYPLELFIFNEEC